MNLLSNAVKFTEAGEVVLRISELTNPGNEAMETTGNTSHSSRFTFEVIDTGAGISQQDQATIFEPFQQGEAGVAGGSGTGLGLAIAMAIVELMGGRLSVESELGVGSRFFFNVPMKPAASKMKRTLISTRQQFVHLAEGYSVLALTADDNPENREVLAKMLLSIGCDVLLADNGQQVIEAVFAHHPDIVFMDIRMPVMDGLAAVQQILAEQRKQSADRENGAQQHSPRVKLVAVSASAFLHQRQEYFEAGFDDFIAKPVDAQRLYECLANLLHVEYTSDPDELSEIDFSQLTLPENLLLRLRKAAELYSATEIEELLLEVRQVEEHGHLLAEKLGELSRNFDMKGILDLLGTIKDE